MATAENVSGLRFNQLTILERLPRAADAKSRLVRVRARCDCGTEKAYYLSNLKTGNTRSCGCTQFNEPLKHEVVFPREYASWLTIRQRCLNHKSPKFQQFGAKGIRLCERWLDFGNFITDLGPCPPDFVLGRASADASYEPAGAAWMDRKTACKIRSKKPTPEIK